MMRSEKLFLIWVTSITVVFLCGIAYNLLPLGVQGEWSWVYEPIKIDWKIIIPLLFCFLFILNLQRIYSRSQSSPRQIVLSLLSLSLIGYCFHMSIFRLNQYGFLNLMAITIHPGATGYLIVAGKVENMSGFIRDYASIVPNLFPHAQTHPPGPIIFFWCLLHLGQKIGFLFPAIVQIVRVSGIDMMELVTPAWSIDVMCTGLIAGFLLPLLGSFITFPVYYLGKELIDEKAGLYAGALSLLFPSLMMFSPTIDQLYPVIAVSIAYFYIIGLKRENLIPIFLSGILLSIGLFLSFSFIVLIAILVFGTFLYWRRISFADKAGNINKMSPSLLHTTCAERQRSIQDSLFPLHQERAPDSIKLFFLKLPVIFATPLIAVYISLFLFFHLNMIKVFTAVMAVNASICLQRSYAKWVLYNLYDFFTFMGIPVTLVFLRLFFKRGISKSLSYNLLTLPFVLTLLALDISGITRGEVARTWMLLMPFAALSACRAFDVEQAKTAVFAILALQFCQLMIYKIFLKVIVL